MLIISGSDLVGKTTFAKKVMRRLNEDHKLPHMLHNMTRLPPSWDYYQDYIDRMCVTSVWDRFHLDELAYRANDDYPSRMTPLTFSLLEAQFRLFAGYQVVVTANDDDIAERFAQRGDEMYDLEQILKVNTSFKMICERVPFAMRDGTYQPQVDAWGDTNGVGLLDRVVNGYMRRLHEYALITKRYDVRRTIR